MSEYSVVIVAGGSGSRMNTDLPKQFIEIAGAPVLVHTIRAFLSFDASMQVVLVLPKDHFSTWEGIKKVFFPSENILLAEGGSSRFQSVKSGLSQVTALLVAIHDAVRPCIASEVIKASFDSAKEHGSGLVVVQLKDSIREVTGPTTIAKDRSQFRIVQTPQTFQAHAIKRAFELPEQLAFTDDATVFEAAGHHIHLVEGSYENIKITTRDDLKVAEVFLKMKNSEE